MFGFSGINSKISMYRLMVLIQIIYRITRPLHSGPTHIREILNECVALAPKNLYRSENGFTLLELLTVLAIIFTLAGVAIPKYNEYKVDAQNVVAISDITAIAKEITTYHLEFNRYPDSLNDLAFKKTTDPWGNPYKYLKIEGAKPGDLRKDHFMVPVNDDYDLYSMGADGKTSSAFTAKPSKDDIVRANGGDYIGLVDRF